MIVEYACGCTDIVRTAHMPADCDIHGKPEIEYSWAGPVYAADSEFERAREELRERFYARHPRAA